MTYVMLFVLSSGAVYEVEHKFSSIAQCEAVVREVQPQIDYAKFFCVGEARV